MSRTKQTLAYYRATGEHKLKEYQGETGRSWKDDPERFADWLLAQRKNWRPNTWKLYRLSVRTVLESRGAPVEVISRINVPYDRTGDVPERAPGPLKRLPPQVLERYLRCLSKTRGAYDRMLALFLEAGCEIGLRPSEWGDAKLINNHLIITNRKNTNGRANGDQRRLFLHRQIRSLVHRALTERDRLMRQSLSWPEINEAMVKRLGTLRRENGLPHITLYSSRHQFAANAKSAKLSKREVADLMGHYSETTAGEHYARKASGWGRVYVTYAPDRRKMRRAGQQTKAPGQTPGN